MLRITPFERELDGLGEMIANADVALGGDAGSMDIVDHVEVVGPIPGLTIEARRLLEAEPRFESANSWRALVQADGDPTMVVDIAEGDGGLVYGVRPGDAAPALFEALSAAAAFEESPAPYDLFWFTVPDVYVTGLALLGAESLFIPTRLGLIERPSPLPMSFSRLIEVVRELVETADAGAGLGGEALVGDSDPSTRSGLPDPG